VPLALRINLIMSDGSQEGERPRTPDSQRAGPGQASLQSPKQSAEVAPDAEPPSEAPVISNSEPDYSIFTTWEKRFIVLGASAAAFFSPLTAQIYLPALNLLAEDFQITSSQVNLTVTTYMVRRDDALRLLNSTC
jgi:hypothetical protein